MTASVTLVRLYCGERIPVGGSESDTRFTDAEISSIIEAEGGGLYAAAAGVWSAKAGLISPATDISENGSDRKLSQFFDHCDKRAKFFRELARMDEDEAALALRASGIGFNAYTTERDRYEGASESGA